MPLPPFSPGMVPADVSGLPSFIAELQGQLARLFLELGRRGHVASETLDETTIGTSNTVVYHKLGRTPEGWRVVDCTAGWPQLRRVAWDATSITMIAAASTIVTLEVW